MLLHHIEAAYRTLLCFDAQCLRMKTASAPAAVPQYIPPNTPAALRVVPSFMVTHTN
jgi:hypothetical protein